MTMHTLYTSFVVSLLVHKLGEGGADAYSRGAYFKFWLIGEVRIWRGANSRIYCNVPGCSQMFHVPDFIDVCPNLPRPRTSHIGQRFEVIGKPLDDPG